MPLPVALAALAAGSAAAGALGLKKGYDAYSDTKEAKEKVERAEHLYKSAEGRLNKARNRTEDALESLGKLKFAVWAGELERFVELFMSLKNVEVTGNVGMGGLEGFVSSGHLEDMKAVSLSATEIVTGGFASVGSGVLAGFAAYGGAMTFASASTGTAISTLSGAAATNATLAWFGGGALTAGGAGMAGGMAVLGGIVAGPVLAVGGVVLSAKAEANLEKAKQHLTKAKASAAEMNTAAKTVEGILKVVHDVEVVLGKLRTRFSSHLDEFDEIVTTSGRDWGEFTRDEKQTIHLATLWAQGLKALLEAPILTKSGSLNRAYTSPLHEARNLLEQDDHG